MFYRHGINRMLKGIRTACKAYGPMEGLIAFTVLSLLVLPQPAAAGNWDIVLPSISLTETYTDNATSTTSGKKESDFITTASTGVGINGSGARANLNLNYGLSFDKHAKNSQLDGARHNLSGSGNIELYEDLLFVNARASTSQEIISRSGTITATERLTSSNQTQVVNYSISPTLRYGFDGWNTSSLSYSFSDARFLATDAGADSSRPAGNRTHAITAKTQSGRRFTRFTWTFTGQTTFSYRQDELISKRNTTTATGQYKFNRFISILGTAGLENFSDESIDADANSGFFWSGGARLNPGPRTSLRLEYGSRFDSQDITGDFSYAISPRTSLKAAYTVTLQTQQQALNNNLNNLFVDRDGNFIDPNTGLPVDPNFQDGDLVDTTFKSENFSMGLSGSRGRNNFSLSLNHTSRTFGTGDSSDKTMSMGGSFSRKLTPSANASLSANYSTVLESRTANGGDTTFNGNATYSYSFAQSLNGSISYKYLNRSSESGDDLSENVISIHLSKSF